MVKGAMNYRGAGMLKHIKGNLNSIGYLEILGILSIFSAHFGGYGNDFWLHDIGAPWHRACIVNEWQTEKGFKCLEN